MYYEAFFERSPTLYNDIDEYIYNLIGLRDLFCFAMDAEIIEVSGNYNKLDKMYNIVGALDLSKNMVYLILDIN